MQGILWFYSLPCSNLKASVVEDSEGKFEEFKELFEKNAGAPWEKKRQAFAVIPGQDC